MLHNNAHAICVRRGKKFLISNKINAKRYCVKNQLRSFFRMRAFKEFFSLVRGTWNGFDDGSGMKELNAIRLRAWAQKNCFRLIDFERWKNESKNFSLAHSSRESRWLNCWGDENKENQIKLHVREEKNIANKYRWRCVFPHWRKSTLIKKIAPANNMHLIMQ